MLGLKSGIFTRSEGDAMQNWEQRIEAALSYLRIAEVPSGIDQRIMARLSTKRVIHLVRARVGELELFETRGHRRSRCWSIASFCCRRPRGLYRRR